MKPSPDLSPAEKEWIDWRWSWLSHQFGGGIARSVRVFHSAGEMLPARDHLTTDDAQAAFNQMRKAMGFDENSARLFVRDIASPAEHAELDEHLETAAMNGYLAAWISPNDLNSPHECVAMIAKQIAIAHLVRVAHLDIEGAEAVAFGELGAVFLGVGVILANAAIVNVTGVDGLLHSWRVQRNTCMTIPMFGYALARFAHHRVERDPDWAVSLQPDVKSWFKRTLLRFDTDPPPASSPSRPNVIPFSVEVDDPEADELWSATVSEIELSQETSRENNIYCVACGYNLVTLGSGQCPECGSPFHPEDLNTVSSGQPLQVPDAIKALGWFAKKMLLLMIVLLAVGGVFMVLYIIFYDIF